MKLHLLRHVQTYNNIHHLVQPVDCISCDKDSLVEFIKNTDTIIDQLDSNTFIICADSLRAMQTLEPLLTDIIDSDKKCVLKYSKNAREVDFGRFVGTKEPTRISGMSMQDYREKTIQYFIGNIEDFRYPGGESVSEVTERVSELIKTINIVKETGLFDSIVIVGHNRLFRHLLVQLKLCKPNEMFEHKFPHGKLKQYNI